MSQPEDKVTKTNGLGLGVDPMQRLASFKPPRDYTLGAAKAKKVFTPNLNVSRSKNKGPTLAASRENKKDDRGKRDQRNDRNRNHRKGPEIIRSSGVFSEGLGKGTRQVSHRFQDRDSASPAELQRPTIRVKDVVRINKEEEEQKIREATHQGDFVEELAEDFKRSLESDAPIRLPMDDVGWAVNKSKPKEVAVKQEPYVKAEPLDDERDVEQKPVTVVKKEYFEDTDVVDLLRRDDPTLILFKFPDTLPGRVGNGEEAPRRKQQQQEPTSSEGTEEGAAQEETKCKLRSLEEGRIGKLQIHRSGRVTMLLGDTIFEVTLGTKSAYHLEVVSVATDPASRSASVINIGSLCHKLTAVPDWESMFAQVPT